MNSGFNIVLYVLGKLAGAYLDVDCASVHGRDRGYAVTKTAIYYCIDDGKPLYSKYKLEGVDRNSFQVLPNEFEDYAKDKNGVFYYETRLEGADPATFQILSTPPYSKDKNHVYYYKKLMNADPKTFEVIGYDYSKDAKNVFRYENKVPGVDPKTFKNQNYKF